MLSKNKCIVLSKIKYKDYDLIIKCYTLERGIVSYLQKGVLKPNKRYTRSVYFQHLSLLEIEEQYNVNNSLQFIKDIKLNYVYKTLHSNIYKSAIVLFLSDILTNLLKEEEKNEALYIYLETALKYLDTLVGFSNFHLLFLVKLSRYLGIQPQINNLNHPYFNLKSGVFEDTKSNYFSTSTENTNLLKQFLGLSFNNLHEVKIKSQQRQSFLNMLIQYFELHLDSFKKPKSLEVFNNVFH